MRFTSLSHDILYHLLLATADVSLGALLAFMQTSSSIFNIFTQHKGSILKQALSTKTGPSFTNALILAGREMSYSYIKYETDAEKTLRIILHAHKTHRSIVLLARMFRAVYTHALYELTLPLGQQLAIAHRTRPLLGPLNPGPISLEDCSKATYVYATHGFQGWESLDPTNINHSFGKWITTIGMGLWEPWWDLHGPDVTDAAAARVLYYTMKRKVVYSGAWRMLLSMRNFDNEGFIEKVEGAVRKIVSPRGDGRIQNSDQSAGTNGGVVGGTGGVAAATPATLVDRYALTKQAMVNKELMRRMFGSWAASGFAVEGEEGWPKLMGELMVGKLTKWL